MHVSHSRARRKPRTYPGQDLAEPLVQWLNRRPSKDLLDLLDTAERHRKALADPGSRVKRELAGWLKAKINAILDVFTFNPLVEKIDHRWRVEWCARESKGGESVMILFVIDLAERGLLHKVRRCAHESCRKWFFAKNDSQIFHSPVCGMKRFRSRAEWKEHRAEYMREWRQNPKTKSRERRNK